MRKVVLLLALLMPFLAFCQEAGNLYYAVFRKSLESICVSLDSSKTVGALRIKWNSATASYDSLRPVYIAYEGVASAYVSKVIDESRKWDQRFYSCLETHNLPPDFICDSMCVDQIKLDAWSAFCVIFNQAGEYLIKVSGYQAGKYNEYDFWNLAIKWFKEKPKWWENYLWTEHLSILPSGLSLSEYFPKVFKKELLP